MTNWSNILIVYLDLCLEDWHSHLCQRSKKKITFETATVYGYGIPAHKISVSFVTLCVCQCICFCVRRNRMIIIVCRVCRASQSSQQDIYIRYIWFACVLCGLAIAQPRQTHTHRRVGRPTAYDNKILRYLVIIIIIVTMMIPFTFQTFRVAGMHRSIAASTKNKVKSGRPGWPYIQHARKKTLRYIYHCEWFKKLLEICTIITIKN